jgi:nucleoid-associated protein YgaU
MKKVSLSILCLLLTLFLAGCVKTYTYQVEREDQVLTGNRGVIMGEAPEPVLDRKATRTMLGVDVTLPPSKEYKAERRELEEEQFAGEREEIAGEAVVRVEPKKELREFITKKEEIKKERQPQEITYTIQKGDTLQKIAKKFLGRSSRWSEIYQENKDIIKSPEKIYPGQVIIIPQTVEEEEYK